MGNRMLDYKLFKLGHCVGTPGAVEALREEEETAIDYFARHAMGDWGDVCQEDADSNTRALENDERIFSVYHTPKGRTLWVITEWDRSATTILLPSEY